MAGAILSEHFKQYGLAWTIAGSVLLHVALLSSLPPFRFDPPLPKPPLQVELVQPEPPAPPAEPEPLPEPPRPQPKPEPKPEPQPRPMPKKIPEAPSPAPPPEPAPAEAPAAAAPPPPVMSIAPKAEEPPVYTAPPPPPEPPRPSGPTDEELDSARKAYGSSLSREIGRHKRYPRIAQMRGWQGSVRLMLQIDENGRIASVTVEEASDREVFNTEALEMVKRMVQPPTVPDTLRGRSFSVRVPITFRLE